MSKNGYATLCRQCSPSSRSGKAAPSADSAAVDMIVKLKIAKLAYLDEEEWFLVVLNAVGWTALVAALYFWGPV